MGCDEDGHAEGAFGDRWYGDLAFEDIGAKLIPFPASRGPSGKGKDAVHGSAEMAEIVEGEALEKCDTLKDACIVLLRICCFAQGKAVRGWSGEGESFALTCEWIGDERGGSRGSSCAVEGIEVCLRKIFREGSGSGAGSSSGKPVSIG